MEGVRKKGTSLPVHPQLEALRLTPRAIDVLALLVHGHSNKVIARLLGISPLTVAEYVSMLLRKFEVSSRSQIPSRVHALHELLLEWDNARRGSRVHGRQE